MPKPMPTNIIRYIQGSDPLTIIATEAQRRRDFSEFFSNIIYKPLTSALSLTITYNILLTSVTQCLRGKITSLAFFVLELRRPKFHKTLQD